MGKQPGDFRTSIHAGRRAGLSTTLTPASSAITDASSDKVARISDVAMRTSARIAPDLQFGNPGPSTSHRAGPFDR